MDHHSLANKTVDSSMLDILMHAKEATAVYTSRELHVGFINLAMLNLWNKAAIPFNERLMDIAPEFLPFEPLLQQVWDSGQTYVAKETAANIDVGGEYKTYYFDFEYRAVLGANGTTQAIINTATNVTERMSAQLLRDENDRLERDSSKQIARANNDLQRLNRQYHDANDSLTHLNDELILSNDRLDRAEEGLRLALESAELGTWYIDSMTREFTPSVRLMQLFGFPGDGPMSFEDAVGQIPEPHRQAVLDAVEAAILDGSRYDLEYPVLGYSDGVTRWLRAFGKAYGRTDLHPAHFSGVVLDITQQKNDELRKNAFISMVSHELKTPLTSLSAYLQLLQRRAEVSADAFVLDALEKAKLLTARMTGLINGFLDVSRFEEGKIYLSYERFAIDQLIDEVLGRIADINSSHPITFHRQQVPAVFADREKIGQVLDNLIGNAIKYSPKGSPIVIYCTHDDVSIHLRVADKGMGVREEHRDRLFDRYFRVEEPSTKNLSGFGIGLYISAEIVRKHDGEIWVESVYGEGSIFHFTIPIN
ncbi:sensor histidine kinase [Sphingobacterium bambusae]|uniref:histidine kinase n=1 Tax=Sphingobacterium bambusae TaxID=662858 RepID=A0ABW6BAL5_9SPHI|nr:ATP-binding protein [Sphingobacterium bambusae]WPL48583.1 ATP-binding protein [Sphingobacterium bambusae]